MAMGPDGRPIGIGRRATSAITWASVDAKHDSVINLGYKA